jgi:RNA polymerase sigma-70 factor (ECF subfamily)
MTSAAKSEITELLRAWSQGEQDALEKLTPLVYGELHRLAHQHMARETPGHTLQTTALVNEVYVRLIDARRVDWQGRAHFVAICARMMRRILTDYARSRNYQKRGGAAQHLSLEEAFAEPAGIALPPGQDTDLVALDEALQRLAALDPRKGQVVELRFYGGLSVKETAEALKLSEESVLRDWRLARIWLLRELSGEKRDGA